MRINEIKIENGKLLDAWGTVQEIEALQLGLRYCTDVFGEKHLKKIELPYETNSILNKKVQQAMRDLKEKDDLVSLLEGKQTRAAVEELGAARAAASTASAVWEDLFHSLGKEEDRVHRSSMEFYKEVDSVIEACNGAFPAPVLAIITAGARTVGRVQDAFGMCVTPAGVLASLRAWLEAQPRLSVAVVDDMWAKAFDGLRLTFCPGRAMAPWKTLVIAMRGIISRSRGKSSLILSPDRAFCMLVDTLRAIEARHVGLGTGLSTAVDEGVSAASTWEGLIALLMSDSVASVLLKLEGMVGLAQGRAAAVTIPEGKCFNFSSAGGCAYGDKCRFRHVA